MSRTRKRILAVAGTVVFGLIVFAFVWFVWRPTFGRPALEKVDEYVWLDQGWGTGQDAALRQRYDGVLDRVFSYMPFVPGQLDDAWREIVAAVQS